MDKICKRCGNKKPINEYYKHKQMGDGFLNICKNCVRVRVNIYRMDNLEKVRSYDRGRGNRQDQSYLSDYRSRYPKKYAATSAINNAVKNGSIKKPKRCSKCDKEKRVVGHHDDYNKPLEVRWLCQGCHKIWHSMYGEVLE
jgi:hypothetical protein